MNKTAIVTGAAGGIGSEVVRSLAADGYGVVATDIVPDEQAVGIFTGNVAYIKRDVTSDTDRRKLIDFAIGMTGRLDCLVNVAGIAPATRMDLLEMTEESYDRVMNVNLKSSMFMCQLAAKQMIKQGDGGFIVNISSVSAFAVSVNRGEYCISKAGMSMMTRLFADRLAAEGICVYEIRPGIIATGMTAAVKDKYDRMIADGVFPIPRWGTPEDVANAVSVLCSGKLAYSTGDVINVDGGFHIQRL
ncbi:MAG: 3-ketoacyl-ACP reductase [Oscillospiraceae bacterium]|nr:3-ketoacyl-ACP reductase [Oscillospiraceae bacterium]